MKLLPPNTAMRWAVHPADQGRILYVDGLADGQPLPKENERITRPFLLDPVTRQPVPVRVVQIVEFLQQDPPCLAVVVARDQ